MTPNGPSSPNVNDHGGGTRNKSEFLKSLSEFFRRDLLTIPVVKKYPHVVVQQKCGIRAATLELDTAAYPNIEYVAGTRLSVYPANPASHVQSIMEHLIDDISSTSGANIALPPTSQWWTKFVQANKGDSLKLALTHMFDIMTAPTREVVRLLAENCFANTNDSTSNNPKNYNNRLREHGKRLLAISASNESWEKWLCSGHRTLKSLFDEIPAPVSTSSKQHKQQPHDTGRSNQQASKVSALRLLGELEIQQPRQYSISNIKSSKRFRTEIIVFQHKFSLRQIQLNLRQLRERESFDKSISSPKSPAAKSPSSPSANVAQGQPQVAPGKQVRARSASPASRAAAPGQMRNVSEASSGSRASVRSIRSVAAFTASPPISTHRVRRLPSFSGPLMSLYATASSAGPAPASSSAAQQQQHQQQQQPDKSVSSKMQQKHRHLRSKMSLLSAPELMISSDPAAPSSPSSAAPSSAQAVQKFEGLCSSYLLNLNTNDSIICEFVENPRFTLKGNRERPIMMIGQDVGLVAFRPFWQQRNLEQDRAQVFYTLFKDLSPKKFGDMQLVCVTGHKSGIEESLFKHEISAALTSKVLSSVTYVHRRHLISILSAAHSKSRILFSQSSSEQLPNQGAGPGASPQATAAKSASDLSSAANLQITNKELLDLGDRIYKLLVELNGCLYTCCDPYMTQAIELLTFESIARNNPQLSRERISELLPKWKGRGQPSEAPAERSQAKRGQRDPNAVFTLENTYERAKIVQEIYDSSI